MSACAETDHSRTEFGYGKCNVRRYGKKIYLTHVLAWVEANGRLPESGKFILHTCDNPPCVNAEHLYEGTQTQNAADRVARGRDFNLSKEGCPRCGDSYAEYVYLGRTHRHCKRCHLAAQRLRRGKAAA